MNPARILCPIDFSETSMHAIEHAVTLAGHYRSRIVALHVLTPMALSESADAAGDIDRIRRVAAGDLAAATANGLDVDVVVDEGQPAGVILDRAARIAADLIVMGTHGKSGFQHLLLGSVTEKVLRKAACPVLTVPPRTHTTSRLPFRHVLCGVDFSASSRQAVREAERLAGEFGASLTLLHVLWWPWDEPPAPPLDNLPGGQGRALTEFQRYSEYCARKRLESLVSDPAVAARAAFRLANGTPHVHILEVAEEEGADVIVLGVHGRNPIDMALFGSTTNQVVRRASCPVMTIRCARESGEKP